MDAIMVKFNSGYEHISLATVKRIIQYVDFFQKDVIVSTQDETYAGFITNINYYQLLSPFDKSIPISIDLKVKDQVLCISTLEIISIQIATR